MLLNPNSSEQISVNVKKRLPIFKLSKKDKKLIAAYTGLMRYDPAERIHLLGVGGES